MPRGQQLIATTFTGKTDLGLTITRDGALVLAVSFLAERGCRKMSLDLGINDRRYFKLANIEGLPPHEYVELLPPATEAEKKEKEVKRQAEKTAAPGKSAGRPPQSGWVMLKTPHKLPELKTTVTEQVGARKIERKLTKDESLWFLVFVDAENNLLEQQRLANPYTAMKEAKHTGSVASFIIQNDVSGVKREDHKGTKNVYLVMLRRDEAPKAYYRLY